MLRLQPLLSRPCLVGAELATIGVTDLRKVLAQTSNLAEAIETLDARLRSNNVIIHCPLDFPTVYWDRVRLREVFENLMKQASAWLLTYSLHSTLFMALAWLASTQLAGSWAGIRTLRLADGPDEVHRNQIARLELKKFEDQKPHR